MDVERLREPSTWAGLAALVALFQPGMGEALPALTDHIGQVLGGVFALAAIVRREGR